MCKDFSISVVEIPTRQFSEVNERTFLLDSNASIALDMISSLNF